MSEDKNYENDFIKDIEAVRLKLEKSLTGEVFDERNKSMAEVEKLYVLKLSPAVGGFRRMPKSFPRFSGKFTAGDMPDSYFEVSSSELNEVLIVKKELEDLVCRIESDREKFLSESKLIDERFEKLLENNNDYLLGSGS